VQQPDDGDSAPIPEGDRAQIKANLVHLMAVVPPQVQRQLSEALSFISASDFPDRWPALLPELVAKLASGDMAVVSGVLETASSIFERFRDAPDTDDNRRVLRVALAGFAAPLTELVRGVDRQLSDALAGGHALATHRATLLPLLGCLRVACVVFHELNWIDLPEFFEDNMAAWMAHFHRYLALDDARVKSGDADVDEGPLEALQAAILDCVALYADKYDEEFEPFLATFVQDAWSLRSTASASR
jgi:exportin-2 (importin alpha re-exporter)